MRKINLTDKNIKDFQAGDSLYINKVENGYSKFYLCEFISINKGIVKAKVIERTERWDKNKPEDIITARKTSCMLWGNDPEQAKDFGVDKRERCHWFNKEGYAK